jgi:hypothetical protein
VMGVEKKAVVLHLKNYENDCCYLHARIFYEQVWGL